MPTPAIRDATPDDSASLACIQVDSYRTAYAGLLPEAYLAAFSYEEQERDWRDLLLQEAHDPLLVAVGADGELLGYALGRVGPTEIAPYDAELVALHVRKAHQRRGAGRALIASMARRLQGLGCGSLLLWTLAENPVRALYERLGGQPIGEKTTFLDDDTVCAQERAYGWPRIGALCADPAG